jgi:hypothetical protein
MDFASQILELFHYPRDSFHSVFLKNWRVVTQEELIVGLELLLPFKLLILSICI